MRTYFYAFSIWWLLCFIMSMTMASTTVPTVIVKAPRKIKAAMSGGPSSVITQKQMQASGVTSLAQTLESLGGIQLQDSFGNGAQVALNMRGFGANANSNTLLLINGIPLSNPDLAPPDLNMIPLNEIESIEVMAGSESVLYGDQAVGGAINIVTREALNNKNKAQLSCSAGSYNERRCEIAFYMQKDKFNHHIRLSSSHNHHYRDHNEDNQNQLAGQLAYHAAQSEMHVYYTASNEYMQFPGPLTAAQVRQNRRQASNDTDFFKAGNAFVHLQYVYQLHPGLGLQTDMAGRIMQGHGVLFSPFEQWRQTYFFKPTIKGTIKNSFLHSITWFSGIDVQADHYRLSSSFGLTNNEQQKYGLFALVNVPVLSSVVFSLGARGAQQSSHLQSTTSSAAINRAFASTLGLTYQFHPDLNLYLRRAESFRFPKADENASAPIGVKGLRTQRGVAYETGVALERDLYALKLGMYQLHLKDEISFDPLQTPQQPFGSNTNLSPTARTGFTFSGRYAFTDHLVLNGQYNYVNARFQQGIYKGNRIPLVSDTIIRMGVDYRIHEHWNIYSEAIYTGNQYAANDNTNSLGKIGGYTTYNMNIRFHRASFSASLRLNNIFNKYYYFYTVDQSGTEFFYPAPGRNIMLTLNYLFL
jgi:iron complex outermembrane receptor protein